MTWTCQRQQDKVRCGQVNPGTAKKCLSCGKLRPKKRRRASDTGLELTYEQFRELHGSELCGICGREAAGERRLHRDHDHKTGKARGLLCHMCNRLLGRVERRGASADWLVAAGAYLKRTSGTPDRTSTLVILSSGPTPATKELEHDFDGTECARHGSEGDL